LNGFGRISAVIVLLAAGLPAFGVEEIDPRVEQAVEKGLSYLSRTQREDGSWPGSYGRSAGVAGLCALAFMAHGEEPGVGDYGKVIDKAVGYVLSCQDSRGVLSGGISPMYSHGFATLALAEVYGMTRNKDVGRGLKKAVDLIVKAQNAEGGWRYSIGSPSSDITVTGCQMMALRAAQNAGIEVPKEAIQKGVRYIKSCVCADGGFSYQAGRFAGSGVARTGIGVSVLSLCGEYESNEVKRGAEYLRYKPLERENYFYYGAYYCSQAMFQVGGSYWKDWNRQVSRAVMERQSADGSWPGSTGGVECCTAMALLSLEVNWRLLPIYQR
jgi:hypothetical protein